MIVNLPFNLRFAGAITFWPFILVSKHVKDWTEPGRLRLVKHETCHLKQQGRWALYGLGVGLLVWYFLYLFCLPFHWNPWRRKWETEAYLAQGVSAHAIPRILSIAPYWLKLKFPKEQPNAPT